jgi:PAS domain S-box-containing protein
MGTATQSGSAFDPLLASVLDHVLDGIISIDEQGRIETFNASAERIFGYLAEEVLGQNVKVLMPEPYHGEHDGYVANYVRTGHAKIIGIGREVRGQRKDGTTFPMELAVGEFRLSGVRHFTGIVRDVSQRTRLEEQLRQSQKMEAVGKLAGGIAHDFNNILTVINGFAEIILRKLPADSPLRDAANEVLQAGERAAEITQQLLAFSRQQVMAPRVVDLNHIVEDTETMLRRLIGEDVALVTVLDPQLQQVEVDPGLIVQVIMNLAVNARDAMPRGGRLTMKTSNFMVDNKRAKELPEYHPGPYVLLSVTDTGTGMRPEVASRVFEPFFTTKGPGEGTGLGLSMVYGIVKQSGGNIEVYSELGIGTTFNIYIPTAEGQTATAPTADEAGQHGGNETILLVEDDNAVRRIALAVLDELGYRVLQAGGGAEALELVRNYEGRIDLLLTDLVMPGQSGREVAEQVAVMCPGVKVIYMSGYTDDTVVRHGLDNNILFVQKPFSSAGLARKVREALDQH